MKINQKQKSYDMRLPAKYFANKLFERLLKGLNRERSKYSEEPPRRQLWTERRRDVDLSTGRVKTLIENGGDKQNVHSGLSGP